MLRYFVLKNDDSSKKCLIQLLELIDKNSNTFTKGLMSIYYDACTEKKLFGTPSHFLQQLRGMRWIHGSDQSNFFL